MLYVAANRHASVCIRGQRKRRSRLKKDDKIIDLKIVKSNRKKNCRSERVADLASLIKRTGEHVVIKTSS